MSRWKDNEPIYLQLRQLVLSQILSGALPEGEAVPSVRQVASDERINPLTVTKAYQLLVEEGVLEKHRGLGMFVTPGAQALALERERQHFLSDEWPYTLARMRTLGVDPKSLLTGEDS